LGQIRLLQNYWKQRVGFSSSDVLTSGVGEPARLADRRLEKRKRKEVMNEARLPATNMPMIVGVSQAIRDILKMVDQVAISDCCVLVEGESGTGKELIARRLCAKSRRCGQPFIPVNCAGISETLFESQFFGHVRGAFTGAEQTMLGVIRTADGGTVFLDEICDIPLSLQPKLLRVLQEQEVMPVGKPIPIKVDTRFLAGTNRNLAELVRRGEFRRDLYHRLNIVRIVLPPLRDRAEDIPVLLDHYVRHYARQYQREPLMLVPDLVAILLKYPWPGNVRELAAWVERLYVTGLPAEILLEMLLGESDDIDAPSAAGLTLEQAERQAIVQAMQRSNFNQRKAARMLQVHRATLARKLKTHRLA
jgi:DNA-binding NtrC family response regulator